MKKILKLIITVCLFLSQLPDIQAQNQQIRFGNEWINYDAPYAKASVYGNLDGNEGIYRITYSQLESAGFPVTSINPKQLQVFNQGLEIAIRVIGEADGRFDRTDYIEFYGRGNVFSKIDGDLFERVEDNANPYRSPYDWYGYYFVTVAPSAQIEKPKRMAVVDEKNPTLNPEISHIQETLYLPDNQMGFGNLNPESLITTEVTRGSLLSNFTNGEGAKAFSLSTTESATIPFNFTDFIANTKVELELMFIGSMNTLGKIDISYKNKVVGQLFTNRYEGTKFLGTIDSINIGGTTGTFSLTYANVSPNQSLIAATYFKVGYRQGFSMAQSPFRKFNLDKKDAGLAKISLKGVLPNTRFYDITDPYNVRFINYDSAADTRTLIVNEAYNKKIIIAENRVLGISGISKVEFRKINTDIYNFLIVASNQLFAPAGGTNDAIKAYADYRASVEGGGFLPLTIDIQQVFDQFGNGYFSPIGVRRFVDFMTNKSKNRIRGLFLIGKGTSLNFFKRTGRGNNKLPPMGFPASDNEMVNGLFGSSRFAPSIPVGRLTAEEPIEVINYLNKVKEHEALPTGLAWRKNILHLAGGTYFNENKTFKSYLDSYKNWAENGVWGMNVQTIQKTTTDYVEKINIREQVNAGLALVTMFGHSSSDFSDVEIGIPQDLQDGYNNKGKYCMILQNGCRGGDAFMSEGKSSLEQWLIAPDKGAIATIAHTFLGIEGYLNLYTYTFYQVAFADKVFVNATIGEIAQETARRMVTSYGSDVMAIAQAQQSLLQGDPLLVMFGKRNTAPFPDFVVTDSDLSIKTFNNANLTAALDSFQIAIAITNTGIASTEKLAISVTRRFSDFSSFTYPTILYPSVRFRDTLYYTITTPKELKAKALGLNEFIVNIDYGNQIPEINEGNNAASLTINLKKASMLPVAPAEYSVVSKQPVYLIAQNTDLFTKERTYRFQLDTSANFNSNLKKDTVVFSYITPQWTTNLLADTKTNDSIVYYWRVRYADLRAEDDSTWANSSFIYIKDSPSGWSQSRFPQFTKDQQKGVTANVPSKRWNFSEIVNKIDVNVIPYDDNRESGKWKDYYMNLDNRLYAYEAACTENNFDANLGHVKLLCLAIDQQTGEPYNPVINDGNFNFGRNPCGTSAAVAALAGVGIINGFDYTLNIPYYMSRVKEGDYVIVMPAGQVNMPNYTNFPAVMAAFKSIGAEAANVAKIPVNTAFFWVGQKGGKLLEEKIASAGASLKASYTIRRQAYIGTINSTLIGPATSWGNVFRNINGADAGKDDSYKLDVLGVNFSGQENVLFSNVTTDAFDLKNINASTFPYLRLRLQVKDSVKRTPYQLQRWQVIYKDVPEGILLYDTLTYRENTVLQVVEGDSIKLKFNFLNISGSDFPEALTVQYRIRNVPTGRDTVFTEKLQTRLLRNQFQPISVKLYSLNFKGDNILTVYVNPKILGEQIYDNNILEARFKVKPDDINPVLEVAFDGKHLLNGDIVSPSPLIVINLKDENRFLLKKDTIGIDILLKSCETCIAKRLSFNDPNVIWTAASAGNGNKFSVEYRPNKLANGNYTLIVQGKDVTGNESGKQPYQINFKVINENTVTNFYPYPNPFSTNTRFVFTLTGEIPDQIRVQIMTITGKVVKTLFKEDLGNLRIGQNLTEYAWNGTDEFGDTLANGVYLYKVDIKSSGKDYEHSPLKSDDLFKNGYGKMYLMR